MKKTSTFLSLTLILTLCIVISVQAFWNRDVSKAKEFMTAGMYPQAQALLKKRIDYKPTDAEAHYQLGICYIYIGNFDAADESFASAVKLVTEYGYKIGEEYRRAGEVALIQSDKNVLDIYKRAIEYQPNLREAISQQAFGQGQIYFDQKKYQQADIAFSVAAFFNPTVSQKVSDLFFNLGNAAEGISSLTFYQITRKYSSVHNEAIGKRLLKLAEDPTATKAEKAKYKMAAAKYLSQIEMNQVLIPDSIVYPRGEHPINLKAGQTTQKWITFPNGIRIGIKSKDNMFKFIYPNGDVVEAWKLKKVPSRYKFKLQAVTDQEITLLVR